VDYLRKALQKFYSKSIGGRDFSMFEAVHLGLDLPFVFPLMPVVSLNTLGSRRLKTAAEMERDGGGDDAPVSWESKVDKFDKRLAITRKQFAKDGDAKLAEMEACVRDTSLYEFFWKYYVTRCRLVPANQTWALMVTPRMAASCALVSHDRHAAYARVCVVAYWRHMPTKKRYDLIGRGPLADNVGDVRRWGGTIFEEPGLVGGAPLLERCLGVGDLVHAFEGPRVREMRWREKDDGGGKEQMVWRMRSGSWKYDWTWALMEMLVDPVLRAWVPDWVVEQYERWNPFFCAALEEVLVQDSKQELCNRQVLRETRFLMEKRRRRKAVVGKEEEELEREKEGGGSDGAGGSVAGSDGSSIDGDAGNEDPDVVVKKAWHRDKEPGMDDEGGVGVCSDDRWGALTAEERLSAAPPAKAARDLSAGFVDDVASTRFASGGRVDVVDAGYWEATNFVHESQVGRMEGLFEAWRNEDVLCD
jgi:hypothetical protein